MEASTTTPLTKETKPKGEGKGPTGKSEVTIPTQPLSEAETYFKIAIDNDYLDSQKIIIGRPEMSTSKIPLSLPDNIFQDFVLPLLKPAEVRLTYIKKEQAGVIPAYFFAAPDKISLSLSNENCFKNQGVLLRDVGIFHQGRNIWPEKFMADALTSEDYREVIEKGFASPLALVTVMALNLKPCGGSLPAAAFRAGMICRGIFPVSKKHYNEISNALPKLSLGEYPESKDSQMIPEWSVHHGAPNQDDFIRCMNWTKLADFKDAFTPWLCDSGSYAGLRHFVNDHYYLSSDSKMAKRVATEKRSLQVPQEWKDQTNDEMWARTMVHPIGFPQLLNWAYACHFHNFLFSSTKLRVGRPHQTWNALSAVTAVVLTIEAMPFGAVFKASYREAIDDLEKLLTDVSNNWLFTSPLGRYYRTGEHREVTEEDRRVVDKLLGICSAFVKQFAETSALASALSFNKQSTTDSAQYIVFTDIWKAYRKKIKSQDPAVLLRQAAQRTIAPAPRVQVLEET